MLQKAQTWSFTFSKLMNILFFGYILLPKSESSLYYEKSAKDIFLLTFYINNIFRAFKIHQEQQTYQE